VATIGLAEAPPGPVSHDTPPEPATRGEPHRAWSGCPQPEQDERGSFDSGRPLEESIELCPGSEPLRPRQPRARQRPRGHGSSP